ncbi:MAG TPA: hypothetical protein VK824_08005, partial [Planctomycetota bacterium]|nr:hypothetical protein [Planctomycetota bacterium]
MVLTIPFLAVLALQAAAPAAQTEVPDFFALGHDQAQFARKLKDAGYGDLAELYCANAEKYLAPGEKEAATLRSVHLDLQVDLATRLRDPIQKKDELKRLLKEKVDFIDAYPGSPEAKDAEQNLPEVYRQLGEAYANALQKSEDPSAVRDLRAEGAEVFERGEGALGSSLETLNEKAADPDLSDADVDTLHNQQAAAQYNLGRTYYFHASLLGSGDMEGEKLYQQCIDTFSDFGLNYSDTLLNYSGLIFTGLSHKALGQNDEALQAFDESIALTELFDTDKQGKSMVTEDGADIISSAVLQKMLLLAEMKRPEDARATADEFFKVIRNPERTEQGLPLLLARMNAEIAAGDTEASTKTAKLLIQVDRNGPFGAQAGIILGSGSGGGSLGVMDMLRIAESLAAKKDYEQAIARSQDAASAARRNQAEPSELAAALALQAACLAQLKRFDEAALAYDVAVETAPAAKSAPANLASAIKLYADLQKTTKKAFYEKRADDRVQQLATKYPNDPAATLAQLNKGRKLEGTEQYAEAADFYQHVAPDSAAYPEAQLSAGSCLYQETIRLAKGKDPAAAKTSSDKADAQLRKAEQVLSAAAEKTLDLELASRLKRSAQQARSTLGELFMIPGLGREADALAVAQENEASAGTDVDRLGEARSLRVRALTATGKLKEAKDFLEALIAKEPNSRPTAGAAGVLARNLDVQASKAFQANAHSAEGEDLWKQAFRYYALSIEPKLDDAAAADEIEKV